MSEFTPEQRAEIKEVVHEALTDFFKGYGTMSKSFIMTTAIIIGSFAVIAGGLKWLLGLFGFVILSK